MKNIPSISSTENNALQNDQSQTAKTAPVAEVLTITELPPVTTAQPTPNNKLETAQAPAKVSIFQGSLDQFGPVWASGWLFDQNDPDKPKEVAIFSDGNLVCKTIAATFREDLLDAGIGNGEHGFRLRIPEALFDGVEHVIEAREIQTGFLLAGSPVTFRGNLINCENVRLEGITLRGDLSVGKPLENLERVLVYEGDELIAEGTSWEGDDWQLRSFAVSLPLKVFDGRAHGFFIRSAESALSMGWVVLVMPYQLTPEESLLKHAREALKATVSNVAGFRYESLIQSLKLLNESSPVSSASSNLAAPSAQVDVLARINQLSAAHQTLVRGFHEHDKVFTPLKFVTHQHPKVSIVIPVHNKFYVTYHCLASLIVSPNQATFEVILVDDGSSDQTSDVLELIDGIQYVRNDESIGFVRACNKGALKARGEYIVMLNNDTETTAGWLDELLGAFEHFGNVGMAGAKLLYPDGSLQEAGGIVWNTADPWNYGRQANPYDPKFCYARQTDYLSGACLMLPTNLWKKIGGFSETYVPAYFEDTDLAFQVRDLGYKTVYVPFAQVIHYEGISNGTNVASSTKRFQEINRPKFKARWGIACRNNGAVGVDIELNKDRNVGYRALVLDAETPRPDLNAGGYAAIKEILMLQALGFKCTFVPQNMAWMGRYTESLQRMGVECLYAPFASNVNDVIERRGQEFDLIYITRYYVARDCIDTIRQFAPKAKIVLMNADLHFLREIRAAFHSENPDDMAKAIETRYDELEVMRKVDLVLSYTDVEKAVILSHNMNQTKVAKCPWVCDINEDVKPFNSRVDIAFLGGFQHGPNAEAVEWFALNVMPLLASTLPEVCFRVYGSNIPQKLIDLAKKNKNMVIEGWVADVAEVYNSCKLFLAPLQSGAGIKGKVIGALCHGLPSILSTIAAEGIAIGDGVHAAVADTPQQWAARIHALYTDEKLWQAMSAHALTFAQAHYGMAQGVVDMQDALLEVGFYTSSDNDTLAWH